MSNYYITQFAITITRSLRDRFKDHCKNELNATSSEVVVNLMNEYLKGNIELPEMIGFGKKDYNKSTKRVDKLI